MVEVWRRNAVRYGVFSALLAGCVFAMSPAAGVGQVSALRQVDDLASDGRIGEARQRLLAWWDANEDAAAPAGFEQALWLRARLTVDPDITQEDLARIIEGFPDGEYVAPSRYRLALLAEARGDRSQAESRLRELLREHPNTALRVEVRDLLDSFTDSGGRGDSPSVGARSGRGRGGRGGQRGGRAVPEAVRKHAVQLGTYQTASEAVALARRAIQAGFEARLVRIGTSQLVRVRVGLFVSPMEAARLLVEIRASGFDGAAVENADREVSIGGGGIE